MIIMFPASQVVLPQILFNHPLINTVKSSISVMIAAGCGPLKVTTIHGNPRFLHFKGL